jgi:hypothetical protein
VAVINRTVTIHINAWICYFSWKTLGMDFDIISFNQSASQGGVFPVPHQPAEDD